MFDVEQSRLAVVGLGYVGLPLAVEFAKHLPVIGFDINTMRVAELRSGHDRTLEVEDSALTDTLRLTYSGDPDDLAGCNVFIITTPTPVDEFKRPDLEPVLSATRTVGRYIRAGAVVVYESTVYPGVTEEVCVPILEHQSGLSVNRDFFVGYSPERINPGDKIHRLTTICKITSGSTPEAAELVDDLYRLIINAGTHRAPSIRVAEAAKVIENTQRDVNIALINELAILFERLEIDTSDVLAAASTKWNFLQFSPGLVGGHCIGVDPYYLTHKAQQVGYNPEMILAGRRINDAMGAYLADQLVKAMVQKGLAVKDSRVLLLGLTFKENCPDLRNTRVVDIVKELQNFGVVVAVHDPWADPVEAYEHYGIDLVPNLQPGAYDAVMLAVAHEQYSHLDATTIRGLLRNSDGVVYDIKNALPVDAIDRRL
ncbi:MAG: nucleotide sugar dehydrogenase [Propionibacteriaceae bacterium]|nr:nucleotide sugar dehydrogenase [Propionibacteriaceae bacterium]